MLIIIINTQVPPCIFQARQPLCHPTNNIKWRKKTSNFPVTHLSNQYRTHKNTEHTLTEQQLQSDKDRKTISVAFMKTSSVLRKEILKSQHLASMFIVKQSTRHLYKYNGELTAQ